MIENRKSEIRFSTSDPKRMLGKFTVRRVFRTWEEDFFNKESGEAESIERSELILDKGIYIDQDVLSEIKFWLDEGSLKEVEVSNQKRMATEERNTSLYPYRASAKIRGKKHTFLLYATSVGNALEILRDFIELEYIGGFTIGEVKEMDFCIILVDKLKTIKQRNIELDVAYLNDEISMEEYLESKSKGEVTDKSDAEAEEDDLKLRFYQINAKIIMRDEYDDTEEMTGNFIVQTFSAVRANLIINKYLRDQQEARYQESLSNPDRKYVKREITAFNEESKIITIGSFIPRVFSEAYNEEES